jgi:arylformamidase
VTRRGKPVRWIDASEPVRPSLPAWPGDPAVRLVSLAARGPFRVSRLSLSTHAGTHVDPPLHYGAGRRSVDEIAPGVFVGEGIVVRSRARALVPARDVEAALGARPLRLLVKTSNSARDFAGLVRSGKFVALSEEAALAAVRAGVRIVLFDGPSVDPARGADWPAHRVLLGAGCAIVEGVRLGRVRPGPCDVVALPLRLERGDGSPARVLVRPHDLRRDASQVGPARGR